MMRPSRTRAWDNLFEQNRHIFQFGYGTAVVSDNRRHVRTEIERLSDTVLSIEQINSLSELVYYAYQLGKEEAK